MDNYLIILGAILIDIMFGWPNIIFRAIGHPVTWIGKLINFLDKKLNNASYSNKIKKINGLATLLICSLLVIIISILIEEFLNQFYFGILISMIIMWPLIAINSMYQHVKNILIKIQDNNINLARKSVSKIVGRNTSKLNKINLIRASIESLGENTSDGIIAPIFWGLLFGLPGIALYKTINTLDSMIGYKNKKYKDFGWAAARVDDLVNIIPSRITGIFYAIVSNNFFFTISTMFKDGHKHVSPNAGYPESAIAGALNIKLSGPRFYKNLKRNDPWLNEKGSDPSVKKLKKAIMLYKRIVVLIITIIVLLLILKLDVL